MIKRIIASVLMFAILLCCASGCKSNEGKKGDTTTENISETSLPEIEIQSDTVKWLCWDSQEVLENENTTLGFFNKLMKEYYGCHLEIVKTNYEELTQKAVQLILSGDSPDMVFFKMADFPNFILNGVVDDVSQYIDTSDPFWSYLDENPLKYRGVNYTCYSGTRTNSVTYFNKQMLTNAGLELPSELYKKNQWTWEKMFEYAKKLTQDTNKDGTADIFGVQLTPLYFYPTCGDDFVKINQDGTFTNNIRNSTVAKSMNYYNNLCKLGYNGGDVWENTAAMSVDEVWQTTSPGYVEKIRDGLIGVAPSPKMEADGDWYVNGGIHCNWLCKGASNPGGALAYAAIVRWLYDSEDGQKLKKEFDKKNYAYPDEVAEDLAFINNTKNFKLNIVRTQGVGNFGQTSIFEMFNDSVWGVPWATTVEKMYPVLQTQIDTVNVKLATENDF